TAAAAARAAAPATERLRIIRGSRNRLPSKNLEKVVGPENVLRRDLDVRELRDYASAPQASSAGAAATRRSTTRNAHLDLAAWVADCANSNAASNRQAAG